jgi:hypothetical protein
MAMDEFRSSTPSSVPGSDAYMSAPKRTSHRKLIIWLVVLLLVLFGALWIADKAPSVVDMGDDTTTEIAPGETLTTAPTGEVIAGFPSELILEDGVVASESYSIAYTEGSVSQPVVSYLSKKTLEQNIEAYGAYLSLNEWIVSHEATADDAPVTFYYATKNNADLNITFAVEEAIEGEEGTGGVKVTIAYVTRAE